MGRAYSETAFEQGDTRSGSPEGKLVSAMLVRTFKDCIDNSHYQYACDAYDFLMERGEYEPGSHPKEADFSLPAMCRYLKLNLGGVRKLVRKLFPHPPIPFTPYVIDLEDEEVPERFVRGLRPRFLRQ